MKFKYGLGERVLFQSKSADLGEQVGTVTKITLEITKKGSTLSYQLNDTTSLSDADILGKIQFLKTPVARSRAKKKSHQTEMGLNGAAPQADAQVPSESL